MARRGGLKTTMLMEICFFNIRGGVRQGYVLSPRLFSCVLEVTLGCWRRKVGTAGVDFQDGMRTLLALRFADDLLLFAKKFQENNVFVGRTGDMFGRSRVTIACAKKEGPDNSVMLADFVHHLHAASKAFFANRPYLVNIWSCLQ